MTSADDAHCTRRASHLGFIAVVVVVVAVIVVFLSLGLGPILTVKPYRPTFPSRARLSAVAQLQSQPASNFVLNSIAGQPPQTREYKFTLSEVQGAPDGFSRPMLVVNGIFPGPTIQANQGDRLVIHVQNNLPNPSSIHWHGIPQNGTNFYDGTSGITECGIPPGKSLTYNFDFGEFSGTTWWQYVAATSSVFALYSTQYTDGISGSLIVHPTAAAPDGLPVWDNELVVQMSDWYHDTSDVLLARFLDGYFDPLGGEGRGNEPVPDSGTINGLGQYGSGGSYFNFTLQRGKRYRIRLANTGSFANIRFSVDSHPLTVFEVDGTLLEPREVAGVTLGVAQRCSVVLHANATAGSYWMRATIQTAMFAYDVPEQNTDVRGIMRYSDAPSDALPGPTDSDDPGPGSSLPDADPEGSQLVPLNPEPAPNKTIDFYMNFSFQKTSGPGHYLAFMNTTSWERLHGKTTLLAVRQNTTGYAPPGAYIAPGDQLLVTVETVQVLDIYIDSFDDSSHPFHLHGYRPWIMGIGEGRYIGQPLNNMNPLRRDTVVIPPWSWIALRFVTDNPGLWAFHCHVAWHMAAGMLMQFNTLPSVTAQLPVPQDVIDQCAEG